MSISARGREGRVNWQPSNMQQSREVRATLGSGQWVGRAESRDCSHASQPSAAQVPNSPPHNCPIYSQPYKAAWALLAAFVTGWPVGEHLPQTVLPCSPRLPAFRSGRGTWKWHSQPLIHVRLLCCHFIVVNGALSQEPRIARCPSPCHH